MTDFFDWLTASDSGVAADRLADAFKLSHQELRKTTTALAPAFALALQRAMIVPGAWGEISRLYKPFMDDEASDLAGGATASPVARDLANALFGSKDLVSSVARQVSVASGVAPDTVEKMIRNISVMTIGTMLRMMMANLTRSQPRQIAEGNYHGAVAEMLRRSANAVEAMGRPSDEPRAGTSPPLPGSDYLNRLFGDALTGRVPWLPPETGPSKTPRPSAGKAEPAAPAFFSLYPALMEEFARGMAPAGGQTAAKAGATAEKPRPAPASRPEAEQAPSPPDESLAEAALTFQKDYARRMMAIFSPHATGKAEPEDG
ncbi:hypothetical protein E3C22_13370 [Jiella endophytica]|uniref:DUF937 domain-containing protein n=1 Tax=Jiella endophytica TaxID=2558362 RepID=A0A4Y8RIJ1_9HYPH|nr:hypothetical protein [Jiella endophytica]TFF21677.1 hypothetical protein E3C22_13370 [Jiella endophytica]